MRKIHALLFVLAMLTGLVGFATTQPTTNVQAASSANDLLSALPASDAVVFVDAQKILNDTLPTVLANRQDIMSKIRKELDKAKNEIGIDPNTIESAALGISFKSKLSGENVVVIVRGRFDSNTAIDSGFAAAEKKGKVKRQEIIYEGRTIHYLKRAGTTNKSEADLNNETAVLVIDSNTVAVSDVKGIRATIDAAMGRNKVNDELVALATRNSSALISFSGNVKAINDLGMNFGGNGKELLEGVNQFYGALWANGTDNLEGQLTLRTDTGEQANNLRDALNGFKILFSGFGSKDREAAIIKDILKGITIEAMGNEVDIKGKVSMSNIGLIVDML
jgi:hypothetical protein